MGTLRFFEEVVSFKIRRTFGFADYKTGPIHNRTGFFVFGATPERSIGVILAGKFSGVFDFELGIFVVLVDGFE